MEISGYDYLLLTHQSLFDIKEHFLDSIKEIWDRPHITIVEQQEQQRLRLFYARDPAMAEHPDTGYILNDKGEGCFSIIGNRIDVLDNVVGNLDTGNNIDSETRILLSPVWSYTLVLRVL